MSFTVLESRIKQGIQAICLYLMFVCREQISFSKYKENHLSVKHLLTSVPISWEDNLKTCSWTSNLDNFTCLLMQRQHMSRCFLKEKVQANSHIILQVLYLFSVGELSNIAYMSAGGDMERGAGEQQGTSRGQCSAHAGMTYNWPPDTRHPLH